MAYFYFDSRDLKKISCRDLLRSLISQLSTRSGSCCDILRRVHKTHEEVQLIAIVGSRDSRAVQFSHFSVKGYLTSPRLAQSHEDVSRFHIDLNAAHTIMAKACLGTLLRLDEHVADSGAKGFPLVEYAAQHWDEMDDLFDTSKPHFAAWLRVHDIDEPWRLFSWQGQESSRGDGSPLYYAALCGFYQLAERLIVKDPEEVNQKSGWIEAPLPVALYKRHFRVADLLYRHGADVYVQGSGGRTPLHIASQGGHVDIMRWLLDHGANANYPDEEYTTPLHLAAIGMCLEVVQILLDHKADPNSHCEGTPLHWAVFDNRLSIFGTVLNVDVNVVRLLHCQTSPDPPYLGTIAGVLERGADVTIHDSLRHSTALHRASSGGWIEVVRLLLSYGAKVDEKDGDDKTPFQMASSKGHLEIMKYLSENGAVVGVRDHEENTPLHDASAEGHVDAMRWLLDHGADANAQRSDRRTPLHWAAFRHLEAVQLLLEHNADANSQDENGKTPLYEALDDTLLFSPKEGVVDIVRRLLDHGANPNIRDHSLSTPLHQASSEGLLEVARLLISYGAKVDEKDGKGMSPFQVAALKGHRELTKLLLEHIWVLSWAWIDLSAKIICTPYVCGGDVAGFGVIAETDAEDVIERRWV
ncbi:Ankyrin repeat-containing domain protein [Lactarius tabidus]